MYVYAGIDEAGYGPVLGPLVVGRAVLAVPALPSDHAIDPPKLWQRLSKAVCRGLTKRDGRIAVNDSKKLRTAASGITHLERGVLAFAGLQGAQLADLGDWLHAVDAQHTQQLAALPWYAPSDAFPWQPLPASCTAGEIAVARGLLANTCQRIGVTMPDFAAAVVCEDRFNDMVQRTRSKASTSFTFVARHLDAIWQRFGRDHPRVVVDRQSGRTRYRELLSQSFPGATVTVLGETKETSDYVLDQGDRSMRVTFTVEAERQHMPVALASMISKYTRELMMMRFNTWFTHHAPHVKPTAGYALDGKRFIEEIEPMLPQLDIDRAMLVRVS